MPRKEGVEQRRYESYLTSDSFVRLVLNDFEVGSRNRLNVAVLQNHAAGGGNGHRGVSSTVARRPAAALRTDEDRFDGSDGLPGGRSRLHRGVPSRFSTSSR